MSDAALPAAAADPAPPNPAKTAAPARPLRLGRRGLFLKYVGLFVGVVSIALLTNGLFEVWFSYQEHKAALVRIQREQAEAAAQKIGQFVKEIEGQLGWTTQLPWSSSTPEQRRFDALRLLRQVPAITELAQLDSSGKEQLRVSRLAMDVIGSGADRSRDPKFTEAMAKKVYYGPVYFRRESEPYMTLALAGSRRDTGVSVVEVNLKLIWDVVSGIKVGQRGYAFVVDRDGRLIAHPDISLVLRNTDLSRLIQVQAAQEGSADAVQEAATLQGRKVLTASARVAPLGWLVFVELPVEEAYAPLYASLERSALVLLGALLLAGLAGLLLARRMLVPIQALRAGAARIGAGDLGQRIKVKTGDELEALADQFNAMAGQLKESYADLEKKVEARTEELSEALEQQTATAEVLKVISRSAFDLQPVLDTLVDSAARLCRAESAFVFLLEDGLYHLAANRGFSEEYRQYIREHPIPPGRGSLVGRTAITGHTVHLPDVLADPEYAWPESQRIGGFRTMLGVPLLREGSPVGVIALCRNSVHPFTDKQIELVTTFADQAVIAIENVRLFEEVQARTREVQQALDYQTATSEVLGVISRSPTDAQPVFDAIVASAVRLCGAVFSNVQLYDGELLHVAATHNFTPEVLPKFAALYPRAPDRSQISGRAVLAGTMIHIDDLLADPDYPRDLALAGNWRAILSVPMLRHGKPVGVVTVSKSEPVRFTDRQVELLHTFADQAVIAIENVRLFEEVQARTRDLSESLEQQTATAEVLQVISRSAFDLDTVLKTLVQTAARLCGAGPAQIFRREGDVYRYAASQILDPTYEEMERRAEIRPGPGTLVGRVALEKRTVQILDAWADPDYEPKDEARIGNVRSMLGVPLLRGGEPIGAFALARDHVEPFTDKQIELVTTFADQAVIAIENVRLFEEVQARTRELTESLEYQTATGNVLNVISRSPSEVEPVFDSIVETAENLCQADFAYIFTLKEDGCYHLARSNNASSEWVQFRAKNPISPGDSSVMGRAVLEGRVVHVPDVAAEANVTPTRLEAHRLGSIRTALAAPLMQDGKAVGVIGLGRKTCRPFSDRQAALIATFADQALIAINNARLFEEVQARTRELQESLEFQTATGDVLNVISRSPSELQPVLDTIVATAARLCEAYDTVILLRGGERLTAAAHSGPIDIGFEEKTVSRGWVAGRSVIDRKPVHVHDLTEVTAEFPEGPSVNVRLGLRTILAIPLLGDNEAIGTLVLRRREKRPFSDKQVAVLQTFADQAVIAIENARLFEEVQARTRELTESLQQQTATAEVLKVISRSAFDLPAVLDTLTASAAKLCEADMAGLARQKDGRDEYFHVTSYNTPQEFDHYMRVTPIRRNRGSVVGRALVEGASVQVPDVLADPEYTYTEAQRTAGFRTILGVPLLREGKPIGVLFLARLKVRPFSEKQIGLVQTFADQAVIAIENARLFEEVQARTRELSESLEYQTATSEVLGVISRSPSDIQPVLDTIIDTAARLCDVRDAIIFLKEQDRLKVAALKGALPLDFDLLPLNQPGWVTGRAVVERRTVHVEDVLAKEDEYPESHRQGLLFGHRTILVTPLVRESEAIGAIAIRRTVVRPFTERQVAMLQTFADQAVIAIENVRLFEEVQARTRDLSEALEYQTATGEVLGVISRAPSQLQPVFDAIVGTAARLCEAEYALVFQLQEGTYHPVAANNVEAEFVRYAWDHPITPGRGSCIGRTALAGETVHIPDCLEDPEYALFEYQRVGKFRTMLGVPLLRDGMTIGVIGLLRSYVKPYTDKQIELVETFADQAVIAIENVRLFEEVQARTRELSESLEYQTATSEVLGVISRSPAETRPVLDTIVQTAARLCGAEYAFVARCDATTCRLVAANRMEAEHIQYLRHHPVSIDRGSVTGRVALERSTIHVPDVLADPEFKHLDWQRVGKQRTVLGVPLLREGTLLGAIILARTEVNPFTDKQIELVETFADQAVIAIENARLFEEVQARTRELARSVEELRALGEVGQAVNSTLDLETVLDTIVAKAVQLSETDAGAIYVYSTKTARFRLRATYGMSQELVRAVKAHQSRVGETAVGRAADQRAPLQVPDLGDEPASPMRDLILEAGFRALLVIPLLRPDRIVGALVVRRKQPGAFAPSIVELLQTFGAQSVLAIQNARLFSEIEEKSREIEIASRHKSQFLANMSHELRTPMNAVLGFTEMLADGLYGDLPPKATTALERVQANGRHLLGLINDVLDLSKIEAGQLSLTLDEYALPQVVQSVVASTESLAKAKGLELRTSVAQGLPFGRGDERRLTQVLLNLVGNAIKFTDHGHVEIGARAVDGEFRLEVTDTGPGIAPEHQEKIFEEFQQVDDSSTRTKGGTGLGLAISKRLVEMHGGTIGVESTPGAGSTFRIVLPVRAAETQEAA